MDSWGKERYPTDDGVYEVWPYLELDGDPMGFHRVEVFIPRGAEGKTCDVVYMNDGCTAFQPGISGHSWNAHQTATRLVGEGKVDPLIIVAVHARKREYEYLPEKELCGLFVWDGGGLPRYADYLVRLKQFIDATYPTRPERRHSTVVGSSHGGLASFFTGCVHGDVFGNLAALSPSFWAGGVFNLRNTSNYHHMGEALRRDPARRPRIWLDWGLKRGIGFHNCIIEAQATRWGRRMGELLQEEFGYVLGSDLFLHEDAIGGHDERAWAHRFGLLLELYHRRGS